MRKCPTVWKFNKIHYGIANGLNKKLETTETFYLSDNNRSNTWNCEVQLKLFLEGNLYPYIKMLKKENG